VVPCDAGPNNGGETCNGLDDDCTGGIDDGLEPIPADNVAGECAGNVQVCMGEAGWPRPGWSVTLTASTGAPAPPPEARGAPQAPR